MANWYFISNTRTRPISPPCSKGIVFGSGYEIQAFMGYVINCDLKNLTSDSFYIAPDERTS